MITRFSAGMALFSAGLVALSSFMGGFAPPTKQIYFVASQYNNAGLVLLDIERNLFAQFARQSFIGRLSDLDWSPDGKQIVFRGVRNISVDLFVMDATGDNRRQLTLDGQNNHAPDWSRDGKRITFTSQRDNNPEIYVMDADGGNQNRLTDQTATDDMPAWSPDGRRIAFQSNRDGNYEIYVMDADGANVQRLTDHAGRDAEPAWSPDGLTIAYISEDNRNYEIYMMNADGTNPRRMTHSTEFEFAPRWSPDGTQILFARTVAGSDFETYVMDVADGGWRQLTRLDMFLHSPVWRS